MFLYNVKLTLRKLGKNKLNALFSILGFLFGFTICLMIGLHLYNELTVDTCFKNHKQLYRTINDKGTGASNNIRMDYHDIPILLENYPEIEAACPVEMSTAWQRPVKTENKAVFMTGFITTSNSFFEMFSIPVIETLSDKPFRDAHSVVLTESTAQFLFGNQPPLGRQIVLNDRTHLTVSSIIKDFDPAASLKANILLNADNPAVRASHTGDEKGRYYYSPGIFLQLNEKASPQELAVKINRNIENSGIREEGIQLQALRDIYLGDHLNGCRHMKGSLAGVFIFSAIGLLILFISIVNYINFNLSFHLSRLKEIGIKKTCGADFKQLLSYHLTESSLWIMLSLAFSILFVDMLMPMINPLFDLPLKMRDMLSIPFLAALMICLFSVVIVSSTAPVYILSQFDIQSFIRGQLGRVSESSAKKWLSISQFAVAIILMVGVFTIQQQVQYLKTKDVGFNDENLLSINLPDPYHLAPALKNALLQYPSIQNASLSMGRPGNIRMSTMDEDIYISKIDVDDAFINTMGMELMMGRDFKETDTGKACIINETAFKAYGWEDLDHRKSLSLDVVGVVKDFHVSSMHEQIGCINLTCNTDHPSSLNLKIHPENIDKTMDNIQKTWRAISPDSPFHYQYYQEFFHALYRHEEHLSKTMNLFAIFSLLISCFGLLGQSYQTCLNRSKEVGIRKTIGASVRSITVLLTKDFAKWILLANLIAWPIAWFAVNQWLQNFAYRIPLTVWPFLLSGLAALAIAVLTVSWQAVRAARANPVEALKYE